MPRVNKDVFGFYSLLQIAKRSFVIAPFLCKKQKCGFPRSRLERKTVDFASGTNLMGKEKRTNAEHCDYTR